MRPSDTINDLIKKLQLKASADLDRRVHEDISRALAGWIKTDSALTERSTWRIIMKSPITKLAAAAVISIMCLTGLFFWKSTGSGIALADVLTRIEQVTGYTYQLKSTTTMRQLTGTRTYTILVSKEHGIKMTITKADPNSVQSQQPRRYMVGTEWYLLLPSNSIVLVNHKKKTYDRFIYDGVKLGFYKEQYNEPRTIIKQILSCEHRSLGQSTIDGITVEGFQTTDLAYGGGFFGEADRKGEPQKIDVKLWVDVNTFLPVRLEEDIVTKKRGRIYEVSYDFRWNVIINPKDFEPNIPDEYRAPVGDVIIRPSNEENAIKGLKLFADIVGDYPVSLERRAILGEIKRHLRPDPSIEELSDEERTKKTNRMLSLGVPRFFYKKLVKENKEPAYYGETVEPGEANKVLLRWKLGDGRYRVIFGDLSAKNVTPEEIAEIEKLSSK